MRTPLLVLALIPNLVVGRSMVGGSQQATSSQPKAVLTFSVDASDAQHARFVVKFEDGKTATFEAASTSMMFSADGLQVQMKGPGTMSFEQGKTAPLGTFTLSAKDGHVTHFAGSPR